MLLLLALSWAFGLVFADCPPGSKYDSMINGCLQYVSQPAAYLAAEQDCISKGGHLVSIQNMFINSHLIDPSTVGVNQNIWMGYNNLMKSDWAWIDGASFTFTNWAGGGPGEYPDPCALVQNANGQWRTEECNTAHPYVCSVTAAAAPKPSLSYCEDSWTIFQSHCYKIYHNQNFNAARAICQSYGADLASIHSYAEDSFLSDLSMTGYPNQDWNHLTWIGLFKGSYGLEWTDGTSVDYIRWGKNQPSGGSREGCVELASDDVSAWGMSGFRTFWNDITCNTQMRAFACKKYALQT